MDDSSDAFCGLLFFSRPTLIIGCCRLLSRSIGRWKPGRREVLPRYSVPSLKEGDITPRSSVPPSLQWGAPSRQVCSVGPLQATQNAFLLAHIYFSHARARTGDLPLRKLLALNIFRSPVGEKQRRGSKSYKVHNF